MANAHFRPLAKAQEAVRKSHLRWQLVHRAAAAAVVAVWLIVALVRADAGTAGVVAVVLALPAACIWFPEALAGDRESGGRRRWSGRGEVLDQECPPLFLRWAGWFVLLWVPLLIFVAGWIGS